MRRLVGDVGCGMPRSLLAIFAHPDDEVFSSGGTLARYADEGVEVHVVCATRGESGKITHPDIPPDSDRAALRERELREACRRLGVRPPIFLDYRDSGRNERTRHDDPMALMNVDEFDIESRLLEPIAAIRPQVMITFDPHGFYGHIDHLKIHRAATAAFWSAGSVMEPAPRRLFYTCVTSAVMKQRQQRNPDGGRSQLDPGRYGVSEDSVAAVIDIAAQATRKRDAIAAHRSQAQPARQVVGGVEEFIFSREVFLLGGARGGFAGEPASDLFEGLG